MLIGWPCTDGSVTANRFATGGSFCGSPPPPPAAVTVIVPVSMLLEGGSASGPDGGSGRVSTSTATNSLPDVGLGGTLTCILASVRWQWVVPTASSVAG